MLIATWNVNSVRARLPRLLPWLETAKPDVVCLQELKCVDEQFPREEIEALGYQIAAYGQKTYNGVAVLSKRRFDDVFLGMKSDAPDADRRVVGVQIGDLFVVSVYVVNGQEVGSPKYAYKLDWMTRLKDDLRERYDLGEKVVVAGDFNVTFDDRDVHDPKAWHEKILCSTPERERLRALVDLGLVDAFRKFHEDGGHFTWWDFRTRGFQRGLGLRIDHILMSPAALSSCSDVWIDRDARDGEKPSDHAPVMARLTP
ncbi:MAG: exodeoxyribonuclease III [Planctomycetes bacterium]|nr:exodeoxyribonuclease III [Planctomycetota bacterium]